MRRYYEYITLSLQAYMRYVYERIPKVYKRNTTVFCLYTNFLRQQNDLCISLKCLKKSRRVLSKQTYLIVEERFMINCQKLMMKIRKVPEKELPVITPKDMHNYYLAIQSWGLPDEPEDQDEEDYYIAIIEDCGNDEWFVYDAKDFLFCYECNEWMDESEDKDVENMSDYEITLNMIETITKCKNKNCNCKDGCNYECLNVAVSYFGEDIRDYIEMKYIGSFEDFCDVIKYLKPFGITKEPYEDFNELIEEGLTLKDANKILMLRNYGEEE